MSSIPIHTEGSWFQSFDDEDYELKLSDDSHDSQSNERNRTNNENSNIVMRLCAENNLQSNWIKNDKATTSTTTLEKIITKEKDKKIFTTVKTVTTTTKQSLHVMDSHVNSNNLGSNLKAILGINNIKESNFQNAQKKKKRRNKFPAKHRKRTSINTISTSTSNDFKHPQNVKLKATKILKRVKDNWKKRNGKRSNNNTAASRSRQINESEQGICSLTTSEEDMPLMKRSKHENSSLNGIPNLILIHSPNKILGSRINNSSMKVTKSDYERSIGAKNLYSIDQKSVRKAQILPINSKIFYEPPTYKNNNEEDNEEDILITSYRKTGHFWYCDI